jgi:hypothetical protein
MRTLQFVEPIPDAYSAAIMSDLRDGARLVRLYPDSDVTQKLAAGFGKDLPDGARLQILSELPDQVLPERNAAERPIVYVLVPDRDEQLPELLLRFLDWEGGWVIVPQTSRYYAFNPLFLISIPKAGTHLLYNLARKMGYRDGIELIGFAEPAYWYCLEYSNSHTPAPDFFIDSVRRSPFGNRAHPFPRTPTLMIYRNPLDILVSEANWYQRDGKASFRGYFSGLSFEERVERLISDPWLLGSIRERVGRFLAWLEFPNVIPFSFEELIGTRGGGDDRIQADLIWSLQLKLQVPGRPESIAEGLFDEDSPTFFKGRLGRYPEALSDSAFAMFKSLDQDFMKILGYSCSDRISSPFPPGRSEEFRRRALRLSTANHDETPVKVEVFLGCNLVRFKGRFYAIPQRLGELNLATLEPAQLDRLISAKANSELKCLLLLGQEGYSQAWNRTLPNAEGLSAPQLLQEDYRGFNLVAYGGKIWASAMAAGPVDFHDTGAQEQLMAEGRLLEAMTADGARAMVDRLHDRQAIEAEMFSLGSRLEAMTVRLSEALAGMERRVDERLESLTRRVSAIAPESGAEPQLLKEDYRGFNLIAFEGEVWAAAMAAGPVDFHDTEAREQLMAEGRLLEAMTADGARAMVDRLLDRQAIEAWRQETEIRLLRDEAVIREYSSGFSYRLKRWIRRLYGVDSPSPQERENNRPLPKKAGEKP